jgi:hypothetical protein
VRFEFSARAGSEVRYFGTSVLRDRPDLLRPFFNEAERQKKAGDYSVRLDKAELELLAKLETLVQSKEGDAQQKVTALTIEILESFRSHQR